MIGAGIFGIAVACLFIFMLVWSIEIFPSGAVKILAYWVLAASAVETVFLLWILGLILFSDVVWTMSVNEFWKDQLSAIYFIKEWLYSWFWNDLLDFFLVYLPAIVFLSVRTTISSILGVWLISVSKR
ncbi:MAG: hypothetical protein ABGY96_28675 [bacterium]|nr:hypothetical protein [Gammaproteobacteria bacterium]HIL96646.1 hypothetical protein [Pseudomonadales bacterium]